MNKKGKPVIYIHRCEFVDFTILAGNKYVHVLCARVIQINFLCDPLQVILYNTGNTQRSLLLILLIFTTMYC